MGRLVYVREVRICPLYRIISIRQSPLQSFVLLLTHPHEQDREAEPRFTGPASRGDYGGGGGGAPRGGYGGGYGAGGATAGGGGRQIYVSNVCFLSYRPFLCHSIC